MDGEGGRRTRSLQARCGERAPQRLVHVAVLETPMAIVLYLRSCRGPDYSAAATAPHASFLWSLRPRTDPAELGGGDHRGHGGARARRAADRAGRVAMGWRRPALQTGHWRMSKPVSRRSRSCQESITDSVGGGAAATPRRSRQRARSRAVRSSRWWRAVAASCQRVAAGKT